MAADFPQVAWDEQTAAEWRQLLRMAVREDLGRGYDWTTVVLVPEDATGQADLVARREGTIAGLPAARLALAEYDASARFEPLVEDGAGVARGQVVARLAGSARSLLTAERVALNVVGRLSGIATLTRLYVDAVAGTRARIYDTRKTTAGWRRLEKYAVRQGGGWNHRLGLHAAILIKDNHLALGADQRQGRRFTPAEAVRQARRFAAEAAARTPGETLPVEVEVDGLEALEEVLPAGPDMVLLDNMSPDLLRQAVSLRDALAPGIILEASGGVDLASVRQIAQTGVERISVGALTHSAPWLDVALDWRG